MWFEDQLEQVHLVKLLAFTSWTANIFIVLSCYAILCSTLRFRRINNLRARYGFTDRSSLRKMTNEEAQKISRHMAYSEFPSMYALSLKLGALRVNPTFPKQLVSCCFRSILIGCCIIDILHR